ncbi:MAG: hypothetical protein AMXMBFR22_13440 [Phycisphaerae bacterium]
MDTTQLPPDFREFLKLLNKHEVRYLVVGGYAVGFHGYPRTTADLDVWVSATPENAARVVAALKVFGFASAAEVEPLLSSPGKLVRMGVPPLRLELLTSISGVQFEVCYPRRVVLVSGDLLIDVISLNDLRTNKAAAGRDRDRDDLSHLPS